MRTLLAALFLLAQAAATLAVDRMPDVNQKLSNGSLQATMSIPDASIKLMESFYLRISYDTEQGTLNPPAWNKVFPGELSPEPLGVRTRNTAGDGQHATHNIKLRALTPGDYIIEPFDLSFSTPQGVISLTTERFTLHVSRADDPPRTPRPISAGVGFNGEPIRVTDSATIPYTVTLNGPVQLIEPDWSSFLPDELELSGVERRKLSTADVHGLLGGDDPSPSEMIIFEIEVTPLAPGVYTIKPVEFTAVRTDQTQEPITVETEPVEITVESILAEGETDLADIKDPVAPPTDYARVALYAAGAAALAGLLAGATIAATRRKQQIPDEPPAPPHARALTELDALLASDLLENRRFKPFFAELSGLARRYIESRYGLHAPTQTTQEFLRDPRTSEMFSPEHDALLRAFLGQADAVKFAEGLTTTTDARAAAANIRRFIEETAPHTAPAPEETPA